MAGAKVKGRLLCVLISSWPPVPVRPHVGLVRLGEQKALGPGLCSTNQGDNFEMNRRLLSVFQLILDAPELLQHRLQAFHNFPRQDRRIGLSKSYWAC